MVVATSIAAFVLVFGLVGGKALLSQMAYQNRVIDAKKVALKQIESNLKAVDSLKNSYQTFVSENPNVLGGSPTGAGPKDGDNAKIVLDALPSRYDFPLLAASLEALITSQNLKILGISGTDEEVAQGGAQTSGDPAPVDMPFQVQVSGSYQSIQGFTDLLLRSIRPFQIQSMEISGSESSMIADFEAQTFYQPAKTLNIEERVVR